MPAQLHARSALATESIFARMSGLAVRHGAINLGQGFPSGAPPAFLLDAAREALGRGDQYTPPPGLPLLREALGRDLNVAPEQVVVTCGATEAMAVLAQALYGPGDEVLMLEPVFDIYWPQARLAGAQPVTVPMRLEGGAWAADLDRMAQAITPRTRALLINSPYNPTGSVFSRVELERIVALAREHDLWIISDEVYDELYYGDAPVPLRTLAPERTFTVGSAGKRLEATGWRVGWIVTPPGHAAQVAGLHQWTTFCAPGPLQAAVALALPMARQSGFYSQLRDGYRARMQRLAQGLRALGLEVMEPQGTYFLSAIGVGLDADRLVEEGRVAVIPGAAFYVQHAAPPGLLRFAFCKPEAEIEEALQRLGQYLGG
ncbi:pyridoxal phosphate-dependent aminotransferase [Deinococcus sonorensis]|uniref:Aminotransferase class I/II-fold pyridoxal phosphate-dependent enzyme n=2 Tax=Deinococcus sonorensis TaxID=309891 RepID=A0AAU7U8R9_9DEIO